MNAAGYVNYSTKSPMASGLTPTDLKSVIKQRTRWDVALFAVATI